VKLLCLCLSVCLRRRVRGPAGDAPAERLTAWREASLARGAWAQSGGTIHCLAPPYSLAQAAGPGDSGSAPAKELARKSR